MAENNSLIGGQSLKLTYRVILVELFVAVFLSINTLLIIAIFSKDYFYKNMRYILFATTLLADCTTLILTNFLLIMIFSWYTIPMWLCTIVVIASSVCNFVTPVTLTTMALERYVAICLPLRHGELCSTRRALHCILIIYSISSAPVTVVLSIFFASATNYFYTQDIMCREEVFIVDTRHNYFRFAVNQFYFLIMGLIIMISYIRIMKVAKAASGENKKSSWKGLKTVIFHGFQLLLCLIHLWCPFIESSVLQIDLILYINVRYFNYITFMLAPRCLSPLIYGLRDEKFFLALKYYVSCSRKKNLELYN